MSRRRLGYVQFRRPPALVRSLTTAFAPSVQVTCTPNATPTGQTLNLGEVRLLMPTQPSKVIALWNNFKALGDKLQLPVPVEPLYLLKSPNSWLNPGGVIRMPSQEGKIVFEGELGIVIGKIASNVAEEQALNHVFGYTCANDVTHADILNRDASFAQWVRAKGFDTFCPLGPVVATGLDPHGWL